MEFICGNWGCHLHKYHKSMEINPNKRLNNLTSLNLQFESSGLK
jgi:hypothetical protein